MPSRVRLTLACGHYDRTQPLISGQIEVEGVDLNILSHLSSPVRHTRMLVNREFDICELSLSQFLMVRDRGLPFIGVPVFPHRRFRHSYIFVRRGANISRPQDLKGRRIGLRHWENTAGLYVRGFLQDDYGVGLGDVEWHTEVEEDLPFTPPAHVSMQVIKEHDTVNDMLLRGELDAVIYPEELPAVVSGDDRIVRLFPNYREMEIDYFRRTRIFPIMHIVAIKEEVLAAHPWLAVEITMAFRKAKEFCARYIADQRKSSLAWFGDYLAQEQEIMGADPWTYDLEENRHTLETLIRYSQEGGLISRKLSVEELVAPTTLESGSFTPTRAWANKFVLAQGGIVRGADAAGTS
jgi:4,5-dihydroxyphthalate decarboxylase